MKKMPSFSPRSRAANRRTSRPSTRRRRPIATIFTDAVLPYAVAREPGDLLSVADERRAYLELYLGGVVT
jgi:hypothetical protein